MSEGRGDETPEYVAAQPARAVDKAVLAAKFAQDDPAGFTAWQLVLRQLRCRRCDASLAQADWVFEDDRRVLACECGYPLAWQPFPADA
jgi:hypothetical protein